jgi:hypothetical protein
MHIILDLFDSTLMMTCGDTFVFGVVVVMVPVYHGLRRDSTLLSVKHRRRIIVFAETPGLPYTSQRAFDGNKHLKYSNKYHTLNESRN